MACEIDGQKGIGNPVSNLLLNNRPTNRILNVSANTGKVTGQLIWKAQAFFGQVKEMQAAAQKALELLKSLTRRRSGRAVGSYRIYLGESGAGDPGRHIPCR